MTHYIGVDLSFAKSGVAVIEDKDGKQSIVDRLTDEQYKQLLQVAEFQLQTTTGFMNDMIRKALSDVKRRRKVSVKH